MASLLVWKNVIGIGTFFCDFFVDRHCEDQRSRNSPMFSAAFHRIVVSSHGNFWRDDPQTFVCYFTLVTTTHG